MGQTSVFFMWQNKTVYIPSIHIKLFYANKQNLILTIKYVFSHPYPISELSQKT